MARTILYGIGDAWNSYRVTLYSIMKDVSLKEEKILKAKAEEMRAYDPGIKQVFAITDYYGLRDDYRETRKSNLMSDWVDFKAMLEKEGIRIV